MNEFKDALLLSRDTLMFLPLIVFCFIPVIQKIKYSIGKLLIKIIIAIVLVELLVFLVYYILPYHIANLVNGILCIVIFFWLYQREIDVEPSHLLFVFLTACLIGGFGYLVYHVTDIFLNPNSASPQILSTEGFLIQVLFECILILILAYPTKKYLGWLVLHFHQEKIWRNICIFPILFTLVFYVFIPLDNSKMYIGRAIELYLIAIFIFIVIAVIIYIMFYQIAYNIVEKQKIREHALYLEMEEEQYRKLQHYVEYTSRLRHDFRYHITSLSGMMERKEYKKAEEYMKKYSLAVSTPIKQYCKSSAINAVLNHYSSCCQEDGIATYFSISFKDNNEEMDTDFCVLLGNLLENALYTCKNQEKELRKIELKVGQTSPHVIVLCIQNPYHGTIKQEGDTFMSMKHKGKGKGLKSVAMIAEKYNGYMTVEHQDMQFVVKVLLNI